MNERRQRRIEALLKERVAEIIDRDLSDPRRDLITVTRVKVDRDLQVCLVFWSVLGGPAAQKRNAEVLQRAARFIQQGVAPILHTRTMPRMKFVHDEGLEAQLRLDGLMNELKVERDARAPGIELVPEVPPADEGLPPSAEGQKPGPTTED